MATETTTAPTTTRAGTIHIYKQRDKYGRPAVVAESNLSILVKVTTLPIRYAETYGPRYVVWDREDPVQRITYHVKRKDAMAHFDEIVARESRRILEENGGEGWVNIADSRS